MYEMLSNTIPAHLYQPRRKESVAHKKKRVWGYSYSTYAQLLIMEYFIGTFRCHFKFSFQAIFLRTEGLVGDLIRTGTDVYPRQWTAQVRCVRNF